MLLVLAAGCTRNPSAPASISGKITYNGQLVTGGSIAFLTETQTPYTGSIKADGTYTIVDLPEGPMTVTIETISANRTPSSQGYGGAQGKAMEKAMEKGAAGEGGRMPGPGGRSPGPPGAEPDAGGAYVKIPAKYADATMSDLKVTVTKGKNQHDFTLTD